MVQIRGVKKTVGSGDPPNGTFQILRLTADTFALINKDVGTFLYASGGTARKIAYTVKAYTTIEMSKMTNKRRGDSLFRLGRARTVR
jgi:hypothetical protein